MSPSTIASLISICNVVAERMCYPHLVVFQIQYNFSIKEPTMGMLVEVMSILANDITFPTVYNLLGLHKTTAFFCQRYEKL